MSAADSVNFLGDCRLSEAERENHASEVASFLALVHIPHIHKRADSQDFELSLRSNAR
jgi:hypothetical protein